jgi:hypothetical protein
MLSAEELEDLAQTASTLVDLAKKQQYVCDDLLGQLTTTLNALDRGTKELTHDMPNNIARQAAQEVVKGIDASVARSVDAAVTRSVAEVLRPVEAKVQTLLRGMEEPVATFRRVARNPVLRYPFPTVIAFACLSGSVSAVLVVLAMKIGIV